MTGVFIFTHSPPVIIHSSTLGFYIWHILEKLNQTDTTGFPFEVNPLPEHNLTESFILCNCSSLR